MIISTYDQQKNINDTFYSLFIVVSLWKPMCILYFQDT